MTEYYWTDEDARYTPSENKNNHWSVRYISSKCEGIKYFKTIDDALEWIDATETNVDFFVLKQGFEPYRTHDDEGAADRAKEFCQSRGLTPKDAKIQRRDGMVRVIIIRDGVKIKV